MRNRCRGTFIQAANRAEAIRPRLNDYGQYADLQSLGPVQEGIRVVIEYLEKAHAAAQSCIRRVASGGEAQKKCFDKIGEVVGNTVALWEEALEVSKKPNPDVSPTFVAVSLAIDAMEPHRNTVDAYFNAAGEFRLAKVRRVKSTGCNHGYL